MQRYIQYAEVFIVYICFWTLSSNMVSLCELLEKFIRRMMILEQRVLICRTLRIQFFSRKNLCLFNSV